MKIEITVTDNEAIMSTPIGDNLYSNHLIITKEAFIECYEKWVKPRKQGVYRNGKTNNNRTAEKRDTQLD